MIERFARVFMLGMASAKGGGLSGLRLLSQQAQAVLCVGVAIACAC